MRMTSAAGVASLVLGLSLALPAAASEPASHAVTLPTVPGQQVVVEWTGTALPGVSGQGTNGGIVDPLFWVPCPSPGPDDAHEITLTVPEGAYASGLRVHADFHIEWDGSNTTEVDAGGLLTLKDPDLVLSVYEDALTYSSSDGGAPEENVGLVNPAGGTYTAVVCSFLSSAEVPYKGRLTLTAVENECVADPRGRTLVNGTLPPGGATIFRPDARGAPNLDLFSAETRDLAWELPTHAGERLQSVIVDKTLGVPTFLWARTDAPIAAVGALNERDLLIEHARAHLRNEAKELRLTRKLIDEAAVADAQFNGEGPAVVRLRQRVNGIEVYHRSLNVMLDRSYRPVAVSGYFAPHVSPLADVFALGAEQAVAAAWNKLGGTLDASQLSLDETRGEWQRFRVSDLAGSHVLERLPRVRQVYYPRAAGLEPAYHVEIFAKHRITSQLVAYSMVVSARDGALLARKDLKSDAAYSYRVFAEPKGPVYAPYDSPLGNDKTPFPGQSRNDRIKRTGSSTNLITLEHAGIVTGDPWLADGATTTSGNNVNACIDKVDTPVSGLISNPLNMCTAGVDPQPAASGNSFDFPVEPDENPANANAQSAAAVNIFYMVNWLHDWWYNHGFNEVAGNAQVSNYGRGGREKDPILAQGQDASGRNNANMATPSDGSSPTMQQYLFDGPVIGEVHQIAPEKRGPLVFTTIANGGDEDYDLEGSLELVNDGMGVSPSDGCGAAIPYPEGFAELSPVGVPYQAFVSPVPQPSLEGKIALVDRGNCNTTFKIQYALANGAVGVIVVNNAAGDPPGNIGNLDVPLAPEQPTEQVYAQMPTVIIRKDDGDRMKAQLADGQEVRVHMTRSPSVDLDGTFDNQIIAHEFFHYVHHRLTDSNSQQTGAMSEGWGDIDGFMMSLRPEDALVPGNDAWQGAYGLAGYVADNFWSGIRRAPYTTDFAKNAYTFRHIQENEPTPDGATGAGNSEVHSAGEIWANMVYECYAGILKSRGAFGNAQTRMKDYIIAGLKLTPADATYTEARDAILAAAMATDFSDYAACSRGFARRGAGLNAQSPARSSADLVGVVEDYTEFVCASGGPVVPRRDVGEGTSPVVGGLGLWLLAPLFGLALMRRRCAS